MNRFFVEGINEEMSLSGDNHSHLAYSLRLRVGEDVELFCGDGMDYLCKITAIKRNETLLRLLSATPNQSEPRVEVHAYLSCIKSDKLSMAYQKLTELGVRRITPVVTEYTQGKNNDFNIQRYQRICIEACKQCGRSVLPALRPPLSFSSLLDSFCGYDAVVFAYERAQCSIASTLNKLSSPKKVAVLIGPEGGFSQKEVQTLVDGGITPISLGARILRAETAAIAAVAAILYELDWKNI